MFRQPKRALLLLVVAAAATAAGALTFVGPTTAGHPALARAAAKVGLHVSGNRLVNGSGRTVVLHGVDRAGSEYACVQGWGIFDGPDTTNDDSQVPLMKSWKVNAAFVGLNEDCWLGINGVKAQYGGARYISAIVHETKSLERAGIHPIIGLFWSASGSNQATNQAAMPDASHSPAFWRSVANTFKHDPNVILRLKEEPFPAGNSDSAAAWRCWKNGDVQYGTSGLAPTSRRSSCNEGYPTVGMQSLINVIRGTGATNVIQVPGVQYANSLSEFLNPAYRVKDTLSHPQLMADVDVYPENNACGSVSCYAREYQPVIAKMPLMAGEIGEGTSSHACPTTAVDSLMRWLDSHHASYAAWDWDTWGGCLQLIGSYGTGAANGNWGHDYRHHLATLR